MKRVGAQINNFFILETLEERNADEDPLFTHLVCEDRPPEVSGLDYAEIVLIDKKIKKPQEPFFALFSRQSRFRYFPILGQKVCCPDRLSKPNKQMWRLNRGHNH